MSTQQTCLHFCYCTLLFVKILVVSSVHDAFSLNNFSILILHNNIPINKKFICGQCEDKENHYF